MAIEEIVEKNISSVAEEVAKFGGKHRSDEEEKKAIQSVPDAAIEGSMEAKSLYLAFSQRMVDGTLYFVVKSIKLSDAIDGRRRRPPLYFCKKVSTYPNSYSTSTNSYSIKSISSKLLRRVVYTPPIDHGLSFVSNGLFRSSIVFAGQFESYERVGKEIWVFESDENLKPNSRIKPFQMPTFNHVKFDPLLVELQGKLYAVNGFHATSWLYAQDGFMEVFDQTQSKWLSLPDPPIMTRHMTWIGREDFSIVVTGQKILLSYPNVRGVVFCFEPEIQNWKANILWEMPFPLKALLQLFTTT